MSWGSQLGTELKAGLRPVVDLVYPPRCPLCGDALAAQGGLCPDCWRQIEVPGEPCCETCQRPMGAAALAQSPRCFACNASEPRHCGIAAASIYNDASRDLILAFKHGGKIALAPLLARMMAARLDDRTAGTDLPLLVPVPLHRWRLWRRGYNQAGLLAQELANLGKGELLVDALIRSRRTPSLGGLGREDRERALKGAIRVRRRSRDQLRGRDVILVDDVLTSGATSDACVNALLQAGASRVKIACFARVIDGRGMDQTQNRDQESETPEVITTPGAT